MNFKLIIPLVILILAAFLYSCVAFRYPAPITTFNHEIHAPSVVEEKMDCFSCHNIVIDEPDIVKRVELLKWSLKEAEDKRFFPGICHKCHVDLDSKVLEATAKCLICHHEVDKILPSSHNGDWKRTHAISTKDAGINGIYYDGMYKDGKKAAFACSTCHEQSYCVDCHTVRNFARVKMHPRTYKIAHVAAGIADPASCGTCHSRAFCIDCHRRNK
jgi:hypothetical protein